MCLASSGYNRACARTVLVRCHTGILAFSHELDRAREHRAGKGRRSGVVSHDCDLGRMGDIQDWIT